VKVAVIWVALATVTLLTVMPLLPVLTVAPTLRKGQGAMSLAYSTAGSSHLRPLKRRQAAGPPTRRIERWPVEIFM